jgi:hypothetical protein
MPNNKKNPKSRVPSIEETNAELEKEFAQPDPKAEDLLPKEGDSKALDESMQSSSVAAKKAEETVSKQKKLFLTVQQLGQMDDPYVNQKEHISLPTVTRPMRT